MTLWYTLPSLPSASNTDGLISIGDRVRHAGTKVWGEVLAVVSRFDGTCDLKVQRDQPILAGVANPPTWWGSYHLDDHIIKAVWLHCPCCATSKHRTPKCHCGDDCPNSDVFRRSAN